eukprot:TRINITY_DN1541_c0_g1_i2.p1 TRINITY_DN1541_c0_g1~~TRINITY_DN1541_c0_g1_i2.p1  ORF type:complete len:258 (+),score=22.66 TRINITY_DN1541_c0_g1_i2:61-774(+)
MCIRDSPHGIQVESVIDKGSSFWFAIKDMKYQHQLTQEVLLKPHDHDDSNIPMERVNKMPLKEGVYPTKTLPSLRNLGSPQSARCLLSCSCSRVLVVDDNDFNQEALIKLLRVQRIRCDTAYNGQECIDKLLSRAAEPCGLCGKGYELIFMDCDMPIMDGLEATKHIKRMVNLNDLPPCIIIACTAFAFESEIEKCLASGMDDFLTKPVNKASLLLTLGKWYHPREDFVQTFLFFNV